MKPYPKYKDSGVEWIGGVPAHWTVDRLANQAIVKARLGWKGLKAEEYVDDGFIFLSTPNIKNEAIDFENVNYITKERYDESPEIMLQAGDVLITKDGSTLGTANVVRHLPAPTTVNSSIAVIRPRSPLASIFLYYTVVSSYTQNVIQQLKEGQGVPHLFQSDLRKFRLLLPPLPEQGTIAAYLDRKTKQIDTLVEQKRKQIDLLREQRTAATNEAVTKGLNPKAKMKDSGIEWIGDIPEHWSLVALKRLSQIKYGLGQPPAEKEGGLPLIRATNVKAGRIASDDLIFVDPKDVPYDRDPVLKQDDIIVVRSGAYTGDSAIIPKEYEGAITGYDMVVRVEKALPAYIAYSLLSHALLDAQINLCRLRAAQPHLNAEELGGILCFVPPIPEQESIAAHLDHKTAQFDTMIAKEDRLIELLQEYRTSLISEVVTGKIDVRNEAVA